MENKRMPNFTYEEKNILLGLIEKYRDIIENKKCDGATNSQKASAWKRVCDEYNAVCNTCRRSSQSLKTCWENIKRNCRSKNRTRESLTGDGLPAVPAQTPNAESDGRTNILLGSASDGLENTCDSDPLLDGILNGKNDDASSSTMNGCADTDSDSEEINMKREKWSPSSLKRSITNVQETNKQEIGNIWTKRKRQIENSLSDQLKQEKINLVRTLRENAQKESKIKVLILQEQLKQEKMKTQNLLSF